MFQFVEEYINVSYAVFKDSLWLEAALTNFCAKARIALPVSPIILFCCFWVHSGV